MRSSEQIARGAFDGLPARHKALVMEWRATGADWATSLLNSGVLSAHGRYVRPDQAARETEREHLEQIILDRQRQMSPVDETYRLQEAAEHEAAHAVIAQSFGLDVKLAYALPGGTGSCLYEAATDPFQTAAIAVGPELWIGTFRALEYPRGPTGCEADRRAAITAVGDPQDLRRAYRYCHRVLKENAAVVLAISDKIERDGCYMP